jgi:hypothetical protein
MENYFKGFTVHYIKRNKNTLADDFAKATSRNTLMPPNVLFQVLVTEPPREGGSSPGSTWVILGEVRTQSTHISTIPYIEVQIGIITT